MNGKYLVTSVLRSLFLGALVLTWSGCSLPQKAEDDTKAKADAERQKGDERKQLEAEIRAKLEKEVAEKRKKAAAEGAKKKEDEAEAKKREEEAKKKAAEEAKKKEEAEAKGKAAEEKVKAAAEAKAKAAEAAAAKKAEENKVLEAKQEKERVDQVTAWVKGLPKSAAAAYCFLSGPPQAATQSPINGEYLQLVPLLSKEWKIEDSQRNSQVVKLALAVLDAEANHEKVTLNPEAALELIPKMTTQEVLLDFHNNAVPAAFSETYPLEDAARRQRVMSNARLRVAIRGLASVNQDFQAYKEVRRKTDDATQMTRMAQEFRKATVTLTAETRPYWKAVNDIRLAIAERELLKQALEACKARLLALGVPADQLADTSALEKKAASLVPTTPKKAVTIFKLKDGRQIRAVVAVEMGDQLSLKDEAGKIETVPKTDILESMKESP